MNSNITDDELEQEMDAWRKADEERDALSK